MSGQLPNTSPLRPLLTLIIAFTVFVLGTVWLTTITQISHDQRLTETMARQQASDIARAVDARLTERIARIDVDTRVFVGDRFHRADAVYPRRAP